ncbi:unnamed protein product [Ilex paraguariensis]|uniref:Uncharacterized protein n=2 Tax=Ilex paraguariensis TaxID=185542 RepID=A0ABC8RG36_9AQUA
MDIDLEDSAEELIVGLDTLKLVPNKIPTPPPKKQSAISTPTRTPLRILKNLRVCELWVSTPVKTPLRIAECLYICSEYNRYNSVEDRDQDCGDGTD